MVEKLGKGATIALAVALAAFVVGLAWWGRYGIHVVYFENATGHDVVIRTVRLKCNEFSPGTLHSGQSRGRVVVRACRGEAAYEVVMVGADGSIETSEVCYVDKLPTLKTIRIVEPGPTLECHPPRLVEPLLTWWQG